MWGGLYSDKVLTKPLLSCQAPYLAQRGFPCRCAEKTVGPRGFSAAPSDPELNHVAVARGKVGILQAAALEGSSSVLCRQAGDIFGGKKIFTKGFHTKKFTGKYSGLKVFTVTDQILWLASAKMKGEENMWKSKNTHFQHFCKLRYVSFENWLILRQTQGTNSFRVGFFGLFFSAE